jgi:hypothetical protein
MENKKPKPAIRTPDVMPPVRLVVLQMTKAVITIPSEMAAGSCHTFLAPSHML